MCWGLLDHLLVWWCLWDGSFSTVIQFSQAIFTFQLVSRCICPSPFTINGHLRPRHILHSRWMICVCIRYFFISFIFLNILGVTKMLLCCWYFSSQPFVVTSRWVPANLASLMLWCRVNWSGDHFFEPRVGSNHQWKWEWQTRCLKLVIYNFQFFFLKTSDSS